MPDDIPPQPASVLFCRGDKTVWLLDLPRTIEESQITSREARSLGGSRDVGTAKRPRRLTRRLISVPPVERPFTTSELKARDIPSTASAAVQVNELMTLDTVEHALQVLEEEYQGPWCLPRHLHPKDDNSDKTGQMTREARGGKEEELETSATQSQHTPSRSSSNSDCLDMKLPRDDDGNTGDPFVPPNSHSLVGTIDSYLPTLFSNPSVPPFNLILLDPPYPNRSATRRRHGHASSSSSQNTYTTSSTPSALRSLLKSIPIPSLLAPGGTVAIWLTNSPVLEDLVTNPQHGVLREWGLEVVDTWTWLKVTTGREPVVGLVSRGKKAWERLVFARKVGERGIWGGLRQGKGEGKGRVVVAVPEAHSRKPNLRALLEEYLGLEAGTPHGRPGYAALEVFARNLTAGWWGWGDEVLKFQGERFWCVDEECGCGE